mmetsp:Transcript_24405/g.59763  ORF Transcript_24405/g.59763 Transcript_24405/m.59763 type:complete len:217 (+) Transcript_24405:126-776(+)
MRCVQLVVVLTEIAFGCLVSLSDCQYSSSSSVKSYILEFISCFCFLQLIAQILVTIGLGSESCFFSSSSGKLSLEIPVFNGSGSSGTPFAVVASSVVVSPKVSPSTFVASSDSNCSARISIGVSTVIPLLVLLLMLILISFGIESSVSASLSSSLSDSSSSDVRSCCRLLVDAQCSCACNFWISLCWERTKFKYASCKSTTSACIASTSFFKSFSC